MMREIVAAVSLALAAACAMAQSPQATPPAPATTPSPDADTTIHYKGEGVIAPELMEAKAKFGAIDECKKLDGEVRLIIVVDRTGIPQVIQVLKSHGDLDSMARHVLDTDKFKPGTLNGLSAIVAVVDDMKLESCRVERKNENGQKEKGLELRSAPEQALELIDAPEYAVTQLPLVPGTAAWNKMMQGVYKVGGGISTPVLLHQADPQYTMEARQAGLEGICMISIIVDANGFPQNLRIVRPLGKGLDAMALEAIRQFRFKPAMKNGKTPVPVMITVEVNFRLH
jgi:TonB family protein